jgi:hypothetical protein
MAGVVLVARPAFLFGSIGDSSPQRFIGILVAIVSAATSGMAYTIVR